MYLTTHRIEAMKPPKARAIHGYLYVHGESLELTPSVFEEITTRDPGGELIGRHTPGPPTPGGNAVLSYLDIVAPDNITPNDLEAKLRDFAGELAGASLPHTAADDACWVRFHISQIRYRDMQNYGEEFEELGKVALHILGSAREAGDLGRQS